MTEKDGIYLHATSTGKLMLVARKGDESVSFAMTAEQAKKLRDEYQSSLSEILPEHDGRNHPGEVAE